MDGSDVRCGKVLRPIGGRTYLIGLASTVRIEEKRQEVMDWLLFLGWNLNLEPQAQTWRSDINPRLHWKPKKKKHPKRVWLFLVSHAIKMCMTGSLLDLIEIQDWFPKCQAKWRVCWFVCIIWIMMTIDMTSIDTNEEGYHSRGSWFWLWFQVLFDCVFCGTTAYCYCLWLIELGYPGCLTLV